MQLLFWVLLSAGQDEIERAFPDPWERSEAYHQRIAKALLEGNVEDALSWAQRAKTRLPEHLRLHLYAVADWLRSRPPDHHQVRSMKATFCMHAGLYEDVERLLLLELNGPRKYWKEAYDNEVIPATSDVPCWIDVAWARAWQGRVDAALEALAEAERCEPESVFLDSVKTARERIEKLRNRTGDPVALQENQPGFTRMA